MEYMTVIDAPSSAGAYGPGQERAPQALRKAGLVEKLEKNGWIVRSVSSIPAVCWQPDAAALGTLNVRNVSSVATQLSLIVSEAVQQGDKVLVLGGDCTVGIGTVAGLRKRTNSLGLIYADYDADLNTPATCPDGALDWMGVAHMLDLPGCDCQLASLGGKKPLLTAEAVLLFGAGNFTKYECNIIKELSIKLIGSEAVAADPIASARNSTDWASQFDFLAVHFDVDLVDFASFALAENMRQGKALSYNIAMQAIKEICKSRNFKAMTVTEINPGHASNKNVETFVNDLVKALGPPRKS